MRALAGGHTDGAGGAGNGGPTDRRQATHQIVCSASEAAAVGSGSATMAVPSHVPAAAASRARIGRQPSEQERCQADTSVCPASRHDRAAAHAVVERRGELERDERRVGDLHAPNLVRL